MSERIGSVAERLAAGPGRGLGCAAEIATEAVLDEAVRGELVAALQDGRALVVARAANALKKVVESEQSLLAPYARELLEAAVACKVMEARWNLLLLLGKVPLAPRQHAAAVDTLFEALGSASALERVHAMQALADRSAADPRLRERMPGVLQRALEEGSAAVQARAEAAAGWSRALSMGASGSVWKLLRV